MRVSRGLLRPAKHYDAIVVGGGHNGLTAAAYLAKAGKKVCVLERRHIVGGAAVTEEIVAGFKFSRASYLLSLLRPVVIEDLKLKSFGLRYHLRNPSSFTPLRDGASLQLGMDMAENQREIAQFSRKDAEAYPRYEHHISRIVSSLEPLMDQVPFEPHTGSPVEKLRKLWNVYKHVKAIGMDGAADFYELMTAPISKVMDKWFESDVLKATLGTDGVIGFAASPYDAGTGYVLLHHVLGGLDGVGGAWGYVYGGMGAVCDAMAKAARAAGAEIYTDNSVSEILVDNGAAKGVRLADGSEIHADTVLSNATPEITFRRLIDKSHLPPSFLTAIDGIDYTSPVTKINVAVKELPNFTARPTQGSSPMPHHQTTIHMNCESMRVVDGAVQDYRQGRWSRRPVIEMTIPSSVDRSICPADPNAHVVLLFTQYTPYSLADGQWTAEKKEEYKRHVFSEIDAYAPNFSSSVIGCEVLPPPAIEETFGLTGGNIFHGSMSLSQLYFTRPAIGHASFATPLRGLFLCGSGAHPGGGVTGAPGRLGALTALKHM